MSAYINDRDYEHLRKRCNRALIDLASNGGYVDQQLAMEAIQAIEPLLIDLKDARDEWQRNRAHVELGIEICRGHSDELQRLREVEAYLIGQRVRSLMAPPAVVPPDTLDRYIVRATPHGLELLEEDTNG